MEVGMGEGAIAESFPWEMWDIRDWTPDGEGQML